MPINAGERGGKKPSRGTDLGFQLLSPSALGRRRQSSAPAEH